MTKRRGSYSEYENMFEALLREKQLPYIAINEAKRAVVNNKRIKSFDFIVSSKNGVFLIDIKGKQFPYGKGLRETDYWENWIHDDDLDGLELWERIFRSNTAKGLLVFPYKIKFEKHINEFRCKFKFKNYWYGLVAVTPKEYRNNSKIRSSKGQVHAIYISRKLFPKVARPLDYFITEL
ncbi:MAG: HYExAFE family protein [Nitrososphaerales archaeon]